MVKTWTLWLRGIGQGKQIPQTQAGVGFEPTTWRFAVQFSIHYIIKKAMTNYIELTY